MNTRLLRKAVGGGLLLALLLAGLAGCSLYIHPLPGVSVDIPIPLAEEGARHD